MGERQKTFSSCFEDERFDERPFIAEVVNSTGVDAYYVFPDAEGLFNDIDRFIWHHDEPVSGTSQYAQWCVMRLVRDCGVTVVLDGQGGDELLAGYHLFFGPYFDDLARSFRWWRLNKEAGYFSRYHGYKYPKWIVVADMIRPFMPDFILRLRRWLLDRWREAEISICLDDDFADANRHDHDFPERYQGHLSQHLYRFFTRDRLPSLLRYEDRNSMAFSVEARLPFLDYRLVEFVFSLPNDQKIRDGTTKVVLRNAMKGVVPEMVRCRMDKMGFVTPQNIWLSSEWAQEIIESSAFRCRPYFKPAAVINHLRAVQKGLINDSSFLWRCINLELWLRKFIDVN
jgi:asparagine synthase (glutamine-hydrolysing)